MADRTRSIAYGDYVRITGRAYKSEFGYVLRRTGDIYSIAVDQIFQRADATGWPLAPVIDCTIGALELVRKHENFNMLDVKDYAHLSFTVHGVAASSSQASENNAMDTE